MEYLDGAYEKLTPIGVGTCICHANSSGSSMREFKILIFESATIYTLATRSISFVEISPLNHEIFDDAMEVGILVAKALLAGAKGAEVLGSLGDIVAEESDDDLSDRLSNWISNTDFKVYFVSHF